jgi:transcriptional regulator with XRE-family HTH domain
MSYQIKVDAKSRKAARFISRLQKVIQKTLIESGKTQQEVAMLLDVDRSVVNRRLKGNANLTARSIAEFAYAFDKEIVFDLVDRNLAEHSNASVALNNIIKMGNYCESPTTGTANHEIDFRFESAAS